MVDGGRIGNDAVGGPSEVVAVVRRKRVVVLPLRVPTVPNAPFESFISFFIFVVSQAQHSCVCFVFS